MTKGTGVVKITPAHDPTDFEVGLRHNLPIVRVFTYDGHMTGAADKAAADAPVSYTHLDVYKRQEQPTRANRHRPASSAAMIRFINAFLSCVKTASENRCGGLALVCAVLRLLSVIRTTSRQDCTCLLYTSRCV